MHLKTLQRTADRLAKQLDCYVSVSLDYSIYTAHNLPPTISKELKYSFYVEFESHRTFTTAKELNKAMNDRIRKAKAGPPVDEGIEGDV